MAWAPLGRLPCSTGPRDPGRLTVAGFAAVERPWRDAVLRAVLPGRPTQLPEGDWEMWSAAAPWLMRAGFRLAVVRLTWGAVLHAGRPLHRLSAEDAERAVSAMSRPRSYLGRQLLVVVRHVAATAWARAER